MSDLDPEKERQNERRVSWLFIASIVGSVFSIVAYIAFPIDPSDPGSVRLNNLLLGLGATFALLGIGFGAVHWSKSLMDGHDLVELRHTTRGKPETVERAAEIFTLGNQESGFTRRKMIRNTLIGALVVLPLPTIVLFRDLAPAADPVKAVQAHHVGRGRPPRRATRAARRSGQRMSRSARSSTSSPTGLNDSPDPLEEKAKAAVLLMRLKPEDLHVSKGREDWNFRGIIAYSKICTHVGCPVALYEQQTHHLLCPCHQSQFDITHEAEVIFGPANRPLPQLPITVDDEGYLVARSDFHEPVGPSFWEREL